MLLPEEVEARATIPALRAMVAKRLILQFGLTQEKVAKHLGVTQAAVSNYLRETRGSTFRLEEAALNIMVDGVAKQIASGADPIAILSRFHEVTSYVRGNRLMCDIHERLEPGLDAQQCHLCDATV